MIDHEVKWLAVTHMHFPQALTNHRHDICVEENDLPTKQQTEDLLYYQTANQRLSKRQTEMRANSKLKIEQTANRDASKFSFPCTRYNPLRDEKVTKFENVMSLPACPPAFITVHHEIRMCSPSNAINKRLLNKRCKKHELISPNFIIWLSMAVISQR